MHILGLSAWYHDSAACLIKDGRIVAAASEERFTRIRHDSSFPYNAVMFCLDRAGIGVEGIDSIVFYEKPLVKFERILQNAVDTAPAGTFAFARAMPSWFAEKLRLPRVLKRELGYRGPVSYVGHHEAHAASAFLASPFDSAAIITIDGVGEWATNCIGCGEGSRIKLLHEIRYPDSIGLLYSAFTEFLGFEVNSDEYKVMGLAPYGEPSFVDAIMDRMIDLHADGSYSLNPEYFEYARGRNTAGTAFSRLFGCTPRKPESSIEKVHMDLARSVQAVVEEVLLRQARRVHAITGSKNLCMAGGVALNCVANGRVLREGPFESVWVQPAAGDAGGALGAALLEWYALSGAGRTTPPPGHDDMSGALLGPSFDDDDIIEALSAARLEISFHGDRVYDEIARRLDCGQVVARFDGPMEFGPRALGSRSILADARNPAMQRTVNEKIKFREGFRPFAPAVLEERCAEWFDLDVPSPYMLLVAQVARAHLVPTPSAERAGFERLNVIRSDIPAVTHVDQSARIQTVSGGRHPDFRMIIEAFERLTGCPVVLNTSFNLRGQPIVCTPQNAVDTFLACDIDALAAGPYIAQKPDGWTRKPLPVPVPFRRPRRPAELRRFAVELALMTATAGAIAFLVPDSPAAAPAFLLWALSAGILAGGITKPGWLRRPESLLHRFGTRFNSGISTLMFAAVHMLVVTPTGLIRRAIFGRRDAGSVGGFWKVPEHPDGGRQHMY